jgi:hypothetical protein
MKRHVRGGVKRVVPEPASDDEGRELVARGKRLLRAAKEDVEGASRVWRATRRVRGLVMRSGGGMGGIDGCKVYDERYSWVVRSKGVDADPERSQGIRLVDGATAGEGWKVVWGELDGDLAA